MQCFDETSSNIKNFVGHFECDVMYTEIIVSDDVNKIEAEERDITTQKHFGSLDTHKTKIVTQSSGGKIDLGAGWEGWLNCVSVVF